MNSCLNDLGHAQDGPFQFAFECALIVDVFDEFGSAEICLVEELESDPARLRKSRGREREPGVGEAGRRNQHGPAVFGQPVVDPRLFQLLDDQRRILRSHRRVQRAEIALMPVMNHREDGGARDDHGRGDGRAMQQRETVDQVLELIHRRRFNPDLQLHLHDFLVSGNHFVSNLKPQLKGHVGALGCQHGGVKIVVLTRQELLHGRIRIVLSRLDAADRALQNA